MPHSKFNAESFLQNFHMQKKEAAVSVYETIDSTNTEALRRLTACTSYEQIKKHDREIFVAAMQTKGRGRTGRTFYSPDSTGIYFSFITVSSERQSRQELLTVRSAVGVCRAIDKCFGTDCKIKWVNDIYLNSRKVCGILAEGFSLPDAECIQATVVGIGINISMDSSYAKENNLSNAGGIVDAADRDMRLTLAAKCIEEIFCILDSDENVMDEYKSRSMLMGKAVTVSPIASAYAAGCTPQSYEAVAVRIEDDASLTVRLPNGRLKSLSSGEVTLHNTLLF